MSDSEHDVELELRVLPRTDASAAPEGEAPAPPTELSATSRASTLATEKADGRGEGRISFSASIGQSAQAGDRAGEGGLGGAERGGEDAGAEERQASGKDDDDDLDWRGVVLLAAQHCSSAFGDRLAEFAFPLYLIELFTDTLLPASIYGFVTTAFGILFSGAVGSVIDRHSRLRAVRTFIVLQKLSASIVYALFLVLFLRFREPAGHSNGRTEVWLLFAAVTAGGSALKLATVGMNVCIERDWVTCIAGVQGRRLTKLNAIMRRVDLLCKLLSPLFVSLLTTAASYPFSVVFLLCLGAGTAAFEFLFIQIVYQRFPALALPRSTEQDEASESVDGVEGEIVSQAVRTDEVVNGRQNGLHVKPFVKAVKRSLLQQAKDWYNFSLYPVFWSSISISLLYLSVLSFDTTFLSYLKSSTDYSDPFIAGMRGICVVTGLLGTFLMPLLERQIGLVRAGTWSISSELLSLVPVLSSFYIGANTRHRAPWNSALLFSGLAASRIGLWSFDLVQLTELQTALAAHPRRNALTGLQFSLQNVFDLAHYALTMGWNKPDEFRYAAAVSFASVFLATLVYVFGYARRLRGHVFHVPLLSKKAD